MFLKQRLLCNLTKNIFVLCQKNHQIRYIFTIFSQTFYLFILFIFFVFIRKKCSVKQKNHPPDEIFFMSSSGKWLLIFLQLLSVSYTYNLRSLRFQDSLHRSTPGQAEPVFLFLFLSSVPWTEWLPTWSDIPLHMDSGKELQVLLRF